MFVYVNRNCDCKVTTTYDENGTEQHSLMVKSVALESSLYAYAPVAGLVMIDKKTGSIIDNRKPIEDFLNLDYTDNNAIKRFVETYGFFINLPDDRYSLINFIDIIPILQRFRILVELMTAIETISIDYDSVFKKVCQLQFSQPRAIVIDSTSEELKTCSHPFTMIWHNISQINIVNTDYIQIEDDPPYNNYYPVYDSFTGKTERLNYITYNEDAGNFNPTDSYSGRELFKANITLLYKNYLNNRYPANDDEESAKNLIDYLYHLLQIDTVIISVNSEGLLDISNNLSKNRRFNKAFKDKLLVIARQTIKEEFDFMLYPIHAVYDMKTMGPGWHVPNLITALYFSLFYTRPDYEIYRKCANPNCNRLFKVKTTNSKQLYHDSACQNAAAQMRHRKKKRK